MERMDREYVLDEREIDEGVVVVAEPGAAGHCRLPSGANARAILGVTTHDMRLRGGNVNVRRAGLALVRAAGSIRPGDQLTVADARGWVKVVGEAASDTELLDSVLLPTNSLGFAETAAEPGECVHVFVNIHSCLSIEENPDDAAGDDDEDDQPGVPVEVDPDGPMAQPPVAPPAVETGELPTCNSPPESER